MAPYVVVHESELYHQINIKFLEADLTAIDNIHW